MSDEYIHRPDYIANRIPVVEGTLAGLFLDAVDRYGDAPVVAVLAADGSESARSSYRSVYDDVRAIAAALASRSIRAGDRVAILSEGRIEWVVADYACLCSGIIDVPIYSTLTPEQIGYILQDSGASLVFAENEEQLEKLRELRRSASGPVEFTIVCFDPPEDGGSDFVAWDAMLAEGRATAEATSDDAFRAGARGVAEEDVATLIYTSGTTGLPKGVMLTHNNLFTNVGASEHAFEIGPSDSSLSFLPLSHVFQRMVNYLLFKVGCRVTFARSIQTVAEDLRNTSPTLVVSVPRLYEKVYNRVMEAHGVKKALIEWAVRVGWRVFERTRSGGSAGGWLGIQHALANRLVFGKIQAGVGGALRFFVSGGAALSQDVHRFFLSAGIPILQGYGLTETSPVTNVNTLDDIKVGTVGRAVPGTEIRIAGDGEILVRGPQVMKGYLNRPEDTRAVIDSEGWFSTGDIGEIDADGHLRITDRKKDLIVTAGGKNIAPQPIEGRLVANRYVDQAVMVGDGRQFVSVLVVPAFETLRRWASQEGIDGDGDAALLHEPRVQAFMLSQVTEALEGLARFETPKKLALLPSPFTLEDGTLTPTQKIKRKVVVERYGAFIDSLYSEAAAAENVFVAE